MEALVGNWRMAKGSIWGNPPPHFAQPLLDIPLAMFPAATRTPHPRGWFPLEGPGFWALPWPFSPWDVSGTCRALFCFASSSFSCAIM